MKLLKFNKRIAHTLLYITELKCYRLDFDSKGEAFGQLESFKFNCPNAARLAECVNTASTKDKPLGNKVWMLYERLPQYLLGIPTMQVEGVDEATLIQALQFELEGMTGQSSIDTTLGLHLLSSSHEMNNYRVIQINNLPFEDLQKAIKTAGSQFGGLLHPAGLPFSLEKPESTDWLRMEFWSQQLVALGHSPGDGLTFDILGFDNRQWRTRLGQWLSAQGKAEQTEALLFDVMEQIPETSWQLLLNQDSAITNWLSIWAKELVKEHLPEVPILQPQSSLNKDLLLMASGGAVALIICAIHLIWHLHQSFYYDEQVADLKKVETALTSIGKSIADSRDKSEKLKERIRKLKTEVTILPNMIQALQQRQVQLLEALANGRPENLVLETIAVNRDVIELRGISLDSSSINELASFLEKQLVVLGWQVSTPSKINMDVFEGGGPYEFTITLQDLGLDGFATKSPTP